jgi:hypothetical protein
MAKLAKSRREKTTSKSKAAVRKVVERAVSLRNSEPAPVGKTASAAPAEKSEAPAAKKISQKFLEAMEKRKGGWGARKGALFGGRPPARRGRRPKASSEYTPENNSEEAYVLESEYERIEYDTGISYKPQGGEDGGFSLDRVDDFDEELNFDR